MARFIGGPTAAQLATDPTLGAALDARHGRLLAELSSSVSAISTANEQTLFQTSMPVAPAVGGLLRLAASGEILNNTGAALNVTIRLKLGATVLVAQVFAPGTNVNRRGWTLSADIRIAAPAAQSSAIRLDLSDTAQSGAMKNASFATFGTVDSTEDLSTAKSLTITAQPSVSSALAECQIRQATLVLLPKAP